MKTDSNFLILDTGNDVISCDPRNEDVGIHWVNITVEDRKGGMDWYNHTLEVLNTNDPPTPQWLGEKISLVEDTSSDVISPEDHFIDVDGDELQYDLTLGPHITLTEFPDGSFIIHPEENWSGGSEVRIKAYDGIEWGTKNISIEIEPANDVPEIVSISLTPEKLKYRDGEMVTIKVNAMDPDITYGDSLTYDWTLKGDGTKFQGEEISIKLPSGMNQLQLVVEDSAGSSATEIISIEVEKEKTTDIWMVLFISFSILILIIIVIILIVFFLVRSKKAKEEQPAPVTGPKRILSK
jgi:hypothetical protein